MTDDVKVVEHIKLVQPIITRMSTSSFAVKGFSLTTQALLLGFAFKDSIWQLNIVFFVTTLLLAMVDMYYLWQERLFRALYNDIRKKDTTDFTMNTSPYKKKEKYSSSIKSVAIWPFYTSLFIINIVALVMEVSK